MVGYVQERDFPVKKDLLRDHLPNPFVVSGMFIKNGLANGLIHKILLLSKFISDYVD